jgi:hypothetical protein
MKSSRYIRARFSFFPTMQTNQARRRPNDNAIMNSNGGWYAISIKKPRVIARAAGTDGTFQSVKYQAGEVSLVSAFWAEGIAILHGR